VIVVSKPKSEDGVSVSDFTFFLVLRTNFFSKSCFFFVSSPKRGI